MLSFIGQFPVTIDKSGRFKLPAKSLEDFLADGKNEIVMYCLPEGCLGIYPIDVWEEMRKQERILDGTNVQKRREMRRFGALTSAATVTKQGRITIPVLLRKMAHLQDPQVMLVGSEVGMELWNTARWEAELEIINELNFINDDEQQEE